MTRMEKWQSYRKEIDQASRVGQAITSQADKIDHYKKEIDRINPAILQNVSSPSLALHEGVSEVIVSQKQLPTDVVKMFKDLNKAKTANNKNDVATILFNLKNDSILNQNNKVKEEWLKQDPNYADLVEYLQAVNLSSRDDKQLEKDLQEKFANLSTRKEERDVYLTEPLSKNGQKNLGHHIFIISAAIAILFFVITFVLLIVRWFVLGV